MANFETYKNTIQELEGGFQKLESDKYGNYNSLKQLVGTNYGISAPTYEKWIGYPPSELDMRAITKAISAEIFKAWFWDKVMASKINSQSVAELFVDHAINAGVRNAVRLMQLSLNWDFNAKLELDGIMGLKTLEAINKVDPIKLFQSYSQYRISYYENIVKKDKTFSSWLEIWKKRVGTIADKFGIDIKKKQ